ncbi:MAG TPA: carbonic anhydrase [Candidatus Acidoferrum sp.]|jgi:carbonic anhydrase|nr:carbonic anhydrase [Candidatus Acidoferrum sp.]
MRESTSHDRMPFNRAAFLAGGVATISAALPERSRAAASVPAGVTPERLLGRLMAGNKRFIDDDFPNVNRFAEKRELLTASQTPFAAILGCSDSRVIPNLVFVQGIGDLFVARVAGNVPDDLVIASLEYSVEHLGTKLIMVLGHEGCGAVKAVYSALATNTSLPTHLAEIQRLMAPGIAGVVKAHGTEEAAVEANVRAAVAKLRTSPPVIASGAASGHLLIVGGIYRLGTGEVKLVE